MVKFKSGSKQTNNLKLQSGNLIHKRKKKTVKKRKENKQIKNHLNRNSEVPINLKNTKIKKNANIAHPSQKSTTKNKINNKKKSSLKEKCSVKFSLPSLGSGKFAGDISEEDIDSDDDLSLDDNELPIPPDLTTSEEETSDEEEEEKGNVNEEEKDNDNEVIIREVEIVSKPPEKEKRTIFVGNLPKSVKKAKLKKWFSKYGTVESVRLRCAPLSDPEIPKKIAVIKKAFHEDRNNIHGFVVFSLEEEAAKALCANGQLFDETHHLRIDMAGVNGQKRRYDDKKAVFVGNLPFGAEEDQLRDHFADCGDIVDIRIVRDKHTSVGKGFAFINFVARHSVRLALEKNGMELNGRKLRIQKALYNQNVEVIKEHKKSKTLQSGNKKNTSSNIGLKFKKRKRKTNEEPDYQGLTSRKDIKRKKHSKKKWKGKKKKETLKNVLNTKSKDKKKLTF